MGIPGARNVVFNLSLTHCFFFYVFLLKQENYFRLLLERVLDKFYWTFDPIQVQFYFFLQHDLCIFDWELLSVPMFSYDYCSLFKTVRNE